MELTVEMKLDRLADFEAQRDLIEANKRAALDEVKIPAEVEAIVKNSMYEIRKAHTEALRAGGQSGLITIEDIPV